MKKVELRELKESEHLAATGLLAHLNPDCSTAELVERFKTIIQEHPHYLPIGAFVDDRLIGLASAWVATKVWCGRYLEIDNIVVHPDFRSDGIGTKLIQHLETIAIDRQCKILVLDSYTSNHPSHRLYHRHGFEIWGFHFVKSISTAES